MKRILLGLTVGILFAYHVGGVVARDLDGHYADSPLHDWWQRSLLFHGRYRVRPRQQVGR
jgi:hypothetical protein